MDNFNEENIPNEFKPISIWSYVGLSLLSYIPCVGLVAMIVFACGAIKNKNIINYARAQLILIGIIIVLYLFLFMFGLAGGIMSNVASTISNT